MKMVPTELFATICELVIETTHFSSSRNEIVQALDITNEELDEVIDYCKKNNGV